MGYNFLRAAFICLILNFAAPPTKQVLRIDEKLLAHFPETDFVAIPAGAFWMGCRTIVAPKGRQEYTNAVCLDDEKPIHQVRIKSMFHMSKYEVTDKQWRAVMGAESEDYEHGACGNCPVSHITWKRAQVFLKNLNQRSGHHKLFRLPTEQEWEYAARAGTNTIYYWGNKIDGDYLWYEGNSGDKTHPVGQKRPNAYGLHDMLGNVEEWTDWYKGDYESKKKQIAPDRYLRVMRGGSFFYVAQACTASIRDFANVNMADESKGFRLVFEQK